MLGKIGSSKMRCASLTTTMVLQREKMMVALSSGLNSHGWVPNGKKLVLGIDKKEKQVLGIKKRQVLGIKGREKP